MGTAELLHDSKTLFNLAWSTEGLIQRLHLDFYTDATTELLVAS